ncbi:MAG: D-alanyl-D-alanine carboxypeptidase [Saccharofermentans sp.]|nr:D-alanyl-D-alanine carboxypeptidase [Clostridiales bacterium]MCR4766333.1 D-alanyl-D-alanine carboxypeptidase [Saccharofermentans sp.]
MTALGKKISASLTALLLTVTSIWTFAGAGVLADETPDDPNDGIVTATELKTDLLNEPQTDCPTISAASYILYDANSGAILLGKDYDVQKEPASMTKVMTVLLALERLELTDIVTINHDMAVAMDNITKDYVKLGLQEGEEISVKDLVYAAVLKSANDASLALGMFMAGTEADFCELMNAKASEIGCTNTHFSSAFGLSTPDNVTTPYDMALILNEAVTNTDYSEISRTLNYTISPTNKYSSERDITNGNRFVSTTKYNYEYYIGGKTGFTNTAGHTLCAAAKKNNRTLVGCIFNAADADIRYSDLIKLFEYGYSTFATVEITESEFTPLIDEATMQIKDLLSDTNLYLSNQKVALNHYITTTSSRAQLGSTNRIDLSEAVIDTSAEQQTLEIPLCKVYSDKTYLVGTLVVEIEKKAGVVEINPEKKTNLTSVRSLLVTFAVLSGLILLLVIVLLIFRARIIKRRRDEVTKRANML